MNYSQLFKDGSLKFIREFVEKIYYEGLGAVKGDEAVNIAIWIIAGLIVIFLLYKLVWWVWNTLIFILNCFTW